MNTRIRDYLLTGLVALLPLAVVILVLAYVYRLIYRFVSLFPVFDLPYGLGIIINLALLFAFILLVGFVTREIFKGYYKNIDGFFLRLPVIGKFYGSVRQITDSLYGNKKPEFKRTVLVEYPRKKVYSIGFVTKEKEIINGKDMVGVFIPTSPLPMSGMIIYVTKDEIIDTDLTVDEAVKMVVSGGFVGRKEEKRP